MATLVVAMIAVELVPMAMLVAAMMHAGGGAIESETKRAPSHELLWR